MMPTAAETASAPWYRHRWPWLLMAGPAIVVVAGFVTLWLAVRSYDGLVSDDYYKQGLGINRTLARADVARSLGVVADVSVAADGAVTAHVEGTSPQATPPQIELTLLRPSHAGSDRRAALVRGADGRYAGSVGPLVPGRWQVVLETDAWRLPSREANAPFERLTLRADPAPGD